MIFNFTEGLYAFTKGYYEFEKHLRNINYQWFSTWRYLDKRDKTYICGIYNWGYMVNFTKIRPYKILQYLYREYNPNEFL